MSVISPSRFYFAFDSEGSSPLEIAVAAVRDGQICNALQLILKPELPLREEAYAIANVHGISLEVADVVGIPQESAVRAMRSFMLSERANVTPDPYAVVHLYCPGEKPGTGDANITEKLDLPWLRLHCVTLDPWLVRVSKAYFRNVTQPNVPVCPAFIHAAFAPTDLRRKATLNRSARAKLSAGYHCAMHDVVRLANFLAETSGCDEESGVQQCACNIV